MDQVLRNSDKANLDLALSEMELGLFSAENQADDKVSSRERWSAVQAAQSDFRGHHSGLALLSTLLKEAKSEIVSDGQISERIGKRFFMCSAFGNTFLRCLSLLL